MLTIENIDNITNCVGFNMWTVSYDTHYSFFVDVGETATIEITLARHNPKQKDGNPHPRKDFYLLQCHQTSWKYNWVTKEDIEDMWHMASLIESFINEVK